MRLQLETGDVKTFTEKVWITGWIIKTNGTNDATLRIEAPDGDVTPDTGYTVPGAAILGQIIGLSEQPELPVTIRLSGTACNGVVYYKRIL